MATEQQLKEAVGSLSELSRDLGDLAAQRAFEIKRLRRELNFYKPWAYVLSAAGALRLIADLLNFLK